MSFLYLTPTDSTVVYFLSTWKDRKQAKGENGPAECLQGRRWHNIITTNSHNHKKKKKGTGNEQHETT